MLGEINNAANQNRTDIKIPDEENYQIITYRGTRMSQDDIDENFSYGKPFEVRGFCSTTTKKDHALNTLVQEPIPGTPINSQHQLPTDPQNMPVLFEFVIQDQMSHF